MRQDLHAVLLLRANNLGFDATRHWNPTHDATQAEYDRFGSVGISTAGNQNPSKPSLPEHRIPVLLLYANDLGFCAIGAGFVEGRARVATGFAEVGPGLPPVFWSGHNPIFSRITRDKARSCACRSACHRRKKPTAPACSMSVPNPIADIQRPNSDVR